MKVLETKHKHFLVIGNPNTGKTTLFNLLTGLKKKTGNHPGITIGENVGRFYYEGEEIELIDLPGAYSLIPNSTDEEITVKTLLKLRDEIDGIIFIGSIYSVRTNLILLTQLIDLGFPVIYAINMADKLEEDNINIDTNRLQEILQIPVILISAVTKQNINELKKLLYYSSEPQTDVFFSKIKINSPKFLQLLNEFPSESKYFLFLNFILHNKIHLSPYSYVIRELNPTQEEIKEITKQEVLQRQEIVEDIFRECCSIEEKEEELGIDKILLHKVWGYVIFFAILFIVFQAIFKFAAYPMDFIDNLFLVLNNYLKDNLPANPLTYFLTDGLLTGINGVVIFVPQIAILFLFIILMEQSGYMSRVIFLMERWLKPFGMDGRSVVPLLAGTACAVPAILSARNIPNFKQRLITILAVPFITCSARLPVYIMIITLVIPDKNILGFVNLQGMVFFSMYVLGVIAALLVGLIAKNFIKTEYENYLILEVPPYRLPNIRTTLIQLWDKVKSFLFGAGKIIVVLSMIIWFLSTHQPFKLQTNYENLDIENSYLGHLGKAIEPVIKPLGYNWQMGIALLTSFAAREVFVSTVAIIYDVDEEDPQALTTKLKTIKNPTTGEPVFNLAVGLSLLVFYAFAMQCMSTLAVIRQETNSWKIPLFVFVYMTVFAYIVSFIVYNVFK